MNPFEKIGSKFNSIITGIEVIQQDLQMEQNIQLKKEDESKNILKSTEKNSQVKPIEQKDSKADTSSKINFATRGQIKEAKQEDKVYNKRFIDPITRIRPSLHALEKSVKFPQKQVSIDRVNDLFKGV